MGLQLALRFATRSKVPASIMAGTAHPFGFQDRVERGGRLCRIGDHLLEYGAPVIGGSGAGFHVLTGDGISGAFGLDIARV